MSEDDRVGSGSVQALPTIIQSLVQVSGRLRHYLPFDRSSYVVPTGDSINRLLTVVMHNTADQTAITRIEHMDVYDVRDSTRVYFSDYADWSFMNNV